MLLGFSILFHTFVASNNNEYMKRKQITFATMYVTFT
jgi:hypothetical protein